MRKAILQVADTSPLESLVMMLQECGYQCYTLDDGLKKKLRSIGCDTVLDIDTLVNKWGYDPPIKLPFATIKDMESADLYVDVKAHRNYEKVVKWWRNLKGKILYYRINGGEPQHIIDNKGNRGNEITPPCPILTPNQWYAQTHEKCYRCDGVGETAMAEMCWECNGEGKTKVAWHNTFRYVCWPPFYSWEDYQVPRVGNEEHKKRGQTNVVYHPPICLIHNLQGWGYGKLVEPLRELGVRFYGLYSPDGVLPHRRVGVELQKSLAMVHLKSSDAPGYAIYEAMASGCPVITTKTLIWKCRMQELLIPGETCLTFHRETHEELTTKDVEDCTRTIRSHLAVLQNPEINQQIGENGRKRLKEIMWKKEKDLPSLQEFMSKHFG